MDVSRTITEGYKIWLAGGAVLLAIGWAWIPRRWALQALIALAVLSGLNYARWGPEAAVKRVDAYDLLHYYINAKYFDELGYLDLYPAVLLVDAENEGPFFDQGDIYMAQDERGHRLAPISHALVRGRIVRAEKFSDVRWAQFEHDVLYLQRTVGCRDRNRKGECIREIDDLLWRQLINDHGFNGTTVWTLVAERLTWVPVEAIKVLGYLDVALLLAALGLVAWAYGPVPALWTTIFLMVSYSTRWPTFSWVFLRYDWVAALLAATALLKRGHPLLAGLLAGWAGTLRFFPALWLWFPFTKGIAGLFRREVRRPLLVLAGGFLLAVAVLQGAAIARFGVAEVRSHFGNMMDHNAADQLSSRRIGLALALATEPWRGTGVEAILSPERKRMIEEQQPFRYALALGGMIVLGFALRRAPDDEAFAFGFVPFYLLTTASYYYYVARAPLILVHADALHTWRARLSLAALFGLELFCNWAENTHEGQRLFLIGTLAWGLAGYVLLQVVWLLWETRRPDPSPSAPADP